MWWSDQFDSMLISSVNTSCICYKSCYNVKKKCIVSLLFLSVLFWASPGVDIWKQEAHSLKHSVEKMKYESFGSPERRSVMVFYWKRPLPVSTNASLPHISQTIESLSGVNLPHKIGNRAAVKNVKFTCYHKRFTASF